MMEMCHICVVQYSSHYPQVPWNVTSMTKALNFYFYLILMIFIYMFTNFLIIPFLHLRLSFQNHFLLHEVHPLSFLVKCATVKFLFFCKVYFAFFLNDSFADILSIVFSFSILKIFFQHPYCCWEVSCWSIIPLINNLSFLSGYS